MNSNININKEKTASLAFEVMQYSVNRLLTELRFMQKALLMLHPEIMSGYFGTDSEFLYFDDVSILKRFRENSRMIVLSVLHSVIHCILLHPYKRPPEQSEIWDIACDASVCMIIMSLDLKCTGYEEDAALIRETDLLRKKVKRLTAEGIYRFYSERRPDEKERERLSSLFRIDDHCFWKYRSSSEKNKSMKNNDREAKWKSTSRQILSDLESFSHSNSGSSDILIQNLSELTGEKVSYRDFLNSFAVQSEILRSDEDSIDYGYYTYGMSVCNGAALIEHTEYCEAKTIHDFIIAVDTSGSVRGKTVQKFVQQTWNILSQTDSVSSHVRIHIIQCDDRIRESVCITDNNEFISYMEKMKIRGLGGTDFRPVFELTDKMVSEGKISVPDGLVYFTDGCGTFPSVAPKYKTAFVFVDNESNNYNVPVWAMKVIVSEDTIIKSV